MLVLDAALQTRMAELIRHPRAKFTAERFFPSWTEVESGGSTAYAGGHGCAVYPDQGGAGEDMLFRARVTTGGVLHIALISGVELESPEDFETLWTATSVTGLVRPDWANNTGSGHGAMIAVIFDSGNSAFCVFAFLASGSLMRYSFNTSGTLVDTDTVATVAIDESMQVASCDPAEVFLLKKTLVEAGQSAWQDDVYGSEIKRYTLSGGTWSIDANDFLFHTHARGDLLYDGPKGDSSSEVEAQWGYRPHGGLAAFDIDDDTALVVVGLQYYFHKAYYTHTMSISGFLYHRDNGIWERSFSNDDADYDSENRLWFSGHCAGSRVDDRLLLSFVRLVEPSDYEQLDAQENIPRTLEAVVSRISDDGRSIAQFQFVGSPDDYCGVQFAVTNHDGIKDLWALGYTAVSQSDPAFWMCDVPEEQKFDVSTATNNFRVTRSNNWQMSVSSKLIDAQAMTLTTLIAPNCLLRAYLGEYFEDEEVPENSETIYVQVGQAIIDGSSPIFNLSARQHQGSLSGRAELNLLDTRAETIDDWFPLQEIFSLPETTAGTPEYKALIAGEQITWSFPTELIIKQGWWSMVKPRWPALFFTTDYPDLEDGSRLVCTMDSTPFAFTGGGPVDLPPGVPGGPGDIADPEKQARAGSMFNDVSWSILEPSVDGCISAVGRFGDNMGQANFEFEALNGCNVSAELTRSNGLITHIEWFSDNCGSPPGDNYGAGTKWNDTYQESCMFGLVARAVHDDLDDKGNGKKYMFIWEAQSDWENGSHLEDQWGRFGEAFDQADWGVYTPDQNQLYLYISDFDETNEGWKADGDWIHKAIAGGITATGLTPGRPAELRMQIYGGTIYCFYRPYGTGAYPKNVSWRFAFSHNSGHFGAGKRGIAARGHTTIQWDVLYTGKDFINRCDNVVHAWDISDTDGVKDFTLRDVLTKYAWQGFTETQYRDLVTDSDRALLSDTYYVYPNSFVENPIIDFSVTIAADDGEAGIFIRSIDGTMDDCVSIGVVVNDTYQEGDNILNCYIIKRRYSSGVEALDGRDYSPSALQLRPGVPYRCRLSVRNDLYSIWIEGCYAGHFKDDTELGSRWGVFASGQAATFSSVQLTELHHALEHALLDPSQPMQDAIAKSIGQRAVKGVFRPTGEVLISRFEDHDEPGDFEDSLIQSNVAYTNKLLSTVQVQGAYTRAMFSSATLQSLGGRRFQEFHMPDIYTAEHCYIEAQAICRRLAEEMVRLELTALPNLGVEPEDMSNVVVTEQGFNGSVLIDGVVFDFNLETRTNSMSISARTQYVL